MDLREPLVQCNARMGGHSISVAFLFGVHPSMGFSICAFGFRI